MSKGTIVSLCDYSGRWSEPWRDAGYRVIQVDPKLTTDFERGLLGITAQDFLARLTQPWGDTFPVRQWLGDVVGVLMAPPCTDFSVSGAQYWGRKDADGTTARALAIVDACLAIKDALAPAWWILENPVGRLPKLRPELGQPVCYVHPYEFAGWAYAPDDDRYTKKTGLWGSFTMPVKAPREPIRVCAQGSWLQKLGGKSERTKTLRSMTPQGLARALCHVNT